MTKQLIATGRIQTKPNGGVVAAGGVLDVKDAVAEQLVASGAAKWVDVEVAVEVEAAASAVTAPATTTPAAAKKR